MIRLLHVTYEGVKLSRQPPWVGVICETPDTKNAHKSCGYTATTCAGPEAECQVCVFTYCQYHFPKHQSTIVLPRDSFKSYRKWLWAQLEARFQGRARGPRPTYAWEADDE